MKKGKYMLPFFSMDSTGSLLMLLMLDSSCSNYLTKGKTLTHRKDLYGGGRRKSQFLREFDRSLRFYFWGRL